MRFVVYNIRYGTGVGVKYHVPLPFSGYFRRTENTLHKVTGFLKDVEPDIVGLVEVDNGSYRSNRINQAEFIANELGFTHVYESKYHAKSLVRQMPLLREQGNAFITNQNTREPTFHYFQDGIKRLAIELEFDSYVIFLVHLSLKYRHRQSQLQDLYNLFDAVKKPKIVAGDFNAFWGEKELGLFMAAAGLESANPEGRPTFPSHLPRYQLDFILHSPDIHVNNFEIPEVKLSDHMPLICDFDIPE